MSTGEWLGSVLAITGELQHGDGSPVLIESCQSALTVLFAVVGLGGVCGPGAVQPGERCGAGGIRTHTHGCHQNNNKH
eukprot:4810490-Pyramimonas_sp.AAC.1